MSHPGWHKGARVELETGDTVEVLDDGVYQEWGDGSWTGMLWHYRVKFSDGQERVIVPMTGDRPIVA